MKYILILIFLFPFFSKSKCQVIEIEPKLVQKKFYVGRDSFSLLIISLPEQVTCLQKDSIVVNFKKSRSDYYELEDGSVYKKVDTVFSFFDSFSCTEKYGSTSVEVSKNKGRYYFGNYSLRIDFQTCYGGLNVHFSYDTEEEVEQLFEQLMREYFDNKCFRFLYKVVEINKRMENKWKS